MHAIFDAQSSSDAQLPRSGLHVNSPYSLTMNPALHTHTGRWRLTTHFLFSSHWYPGDSHGLVHCPVWSHRKFSGHSVSVRHGVATLASPGRFGIDSQLGSGMQALLGRPMWQSGHEHRGRCRTVWQRAFSPQAPRKLHGSRHWLFMHALSVPQSWSVLHVSSTVRVKVMIERL